MSSRRCGRHCEKSKAGLGGLKRQLEEARDGSSNSAGVASARQTRQTTHRRRARNAGGGPTPASLASQHSSGGTSAESSTLTSTEEDAMPPLAGPAEAGNQGSDSSLVELNFWDYKDKPDALGTLLSENGHVHLRQAYPHEQKLVGLFVSHIASGDIKTYRSAGTGSKTDPSTYRFTLQVKGPLLTEGPVGYVRALTGTGKRFLQELALHSSATTVYNLGHNHYERSDIPPLLIGPHADYGKDDVDEQGRPSMHVVRQVLSAAMSYILNFDMVLVRYVDDGSGELTKTQRKIAMFSVKVSESIYSYCMDPVGSGRHIKYRMTDENGVEWNVLFRHHTNRADDTSDMARMISNFDFHYPTAEAAATGMASFATGSQENDSFVEWVTSHPTQATPPAGIDAALKSVKPYEWGDTCECRSCDNRATCLDTRGFGNDGGDPPPKNVRGVVILPGEVVVTFWKGYDPTAEDGPGNERIVGVISVVTKDGDSFTVGVIFDEGNDDRFFWETKDLELLHPANETDKVGHLGERRSDAVGSGTILRHVSCDACVRADEGILVNSGKLIENPCPKCMRQETLRGCKGCPDCCCHPTCRGLPGDDGTRRFFCGGGDEEVEEGVELTVENIARGGGPRAGYLCNKCYTKSHRKETTEAEGTEAETWMALWEALEEHPDWYRHQTGGNKGSLNSKACLGFIDGVPAIAPLVNKFGTDHGKLKTAMGNNFAKKEPRKQIKACPDKCPSCKESESGACEYVGTKITNLASYKQYLIHSNGGNWKCGGKVGSSRAERRKSRFADLMD